MKETPKVTTTIYSGRVNITQDTTVVGDLVLSEGLIIDLSNRSVTYYGYGPGYVAYNLTVLGLTTINGSAQLTGGTFDAESGFSDVNSTSWDTSGFVVVSAVFENPGEGLLVGNVITLKTAYNSITVNPGVFQNDAGATLTLGDFTYGPNEYVGSAIIGESQGSTVINNGTIVSEGPSGPTTELFSPGRSLDVDTLINNGLIESYSGALYVGGMINGTGTLQVDSNALLAIGGMTVLDASHGNVVKFDGNDGTLLINLPQVITAAVAGAPTAQGFNLTIAGFNDSDTLSINTNSIGAQYMGQYPTINGVSIPIYFAATNTTTVTLEYNGNTIFNLSFQGDYSHHHFTVVAHDDSAGPFSAYYGTGHYVDLKVACYARSTLVETSKGAVAVEDLAIGDAVMTRSGEHRPIRWIGRRSYGGWLAASNPKIWPIRFKAGSLANKIPRRDLLVSPEHAMFVDGVLIPARALVNGTSITRETAPETIEYFHIELDSHDVLLAEGAWSESFVDDDSRGMFHNVAEYCLLYPDSVRRTAQYCAPRIEEGFQLQAVQRRLAARARRLQPDGTAGAPAPMIGSLDVATRNAVEGWACYAESPSQPVTLVICDHDVELGRVVADRYRADLDQAEIGDGRIGFKLLFPVPLPADTRRRIEVWNADDWAGLPGAPIVIEAEDLPAPDRPLGAVLGQIEILDRSRIAGWAVDSFGLDRAVGLIVTANDAVIGRVLANRYRPDLAARNYGQGQHGFEFPMPPDLSHATAQTIRVLREADRFELTGSPVVLPGLTRFDPDAAGAMAALFDAVTDPAETDRALGFLLTQADRLRQRLADERSNRSQRDWQRRGLARVAAPVPQRVLVIDDVVPDAGRDAGSVAILSHMRALRDLGWSVSFVAAQGGRNDPALEHGFEWCGDPYHVSVEDVLKRQAAGFDAVYLHRAGNAERYLPLVRLYQPTALVLYSVADLHHLRLARQAQIEGRPELLALSRRQRAVEYAAARAADIVLTHSPAEAALLRREVPPQKIHVVPWAVPARPITVPFEERHGIAFIGGFAHAPNPDAVAWLREAVMPLVWACDPDITCQIVGPGWPGHFASGAEPRIRLSGQLDMLDTLFGGLRATVAPLRFGAGIKGKVLESFAHGVPCAMTPIAAEGLTLPGVLQTLLGADAATLAAVILSLHQDGAANRRAAAAGFAMIDAKFSPDGIRGALGAALQAGRPAWNAAATVARAS